jgi:alkylation response protein AidB-like acyl-CoA dehydrogenase
VDFEFSSDQEMLRESVRRFLSDRAPVPYVRAVYERDVVEADDVWRGLRSLGVTALLVPEQSGGAGMGLVDAAVVLEELGRAVCPAPYASSCIGAASLIVFAGSAREHEFLLPGIADGSVIGTLALYEDGTAYDWLVPSTTARRDGEVWRVDGAKTHVADASIAGLLLVTARDGDGELGVFAVEGSADGVEVSPTPTVDGSRKQGTVTLTSAVGWRLGGADAVDAVARTLDRLGVAYAVDGVGAAQRALELAVEYAKERRQFGKPIGSFQAVQHLCADMLRTVELGRAAAYYACWAADNAPAEEAHRAAVMAQAFAADAFPQLGGTAIQVFGGIGFTWEHDIHLFYKRLLSVGTALGSADDHLAELANLTLT